MSEYTFRLRAANKRALMTNIWHNLDGWLSGSPDLEIVIRPYKSKRSSEQNRRLWKIYETISEQVYVGGRKYHRELWHEYCKRTFIGATELPNGETVGISTTTLNTAQMAEYQNKIQAWAAQEHGVVWEF